MDENHEKWYEWCLRNCLITLWIKPVRRRMGLLHPFFDEDMASSFWWCRRSSWIPNDDGMPKTPLGRWCPMAGSPRKVMKVAWHRVVNNRLYLQESKLLKETPHHFDVIVMSLWCCACPKVWSLLVSIEYRWLRYRMHFQREREVVLVHQHAPLS